MEPFFEEYPWLLIPVVIVIVEAWNAIKAVVAKRFLAAGDRGHDRD